MDTLVASSPKTRSWLNQIRIEIEKRNQFLTYKEEKYWAIFKSSNKDVCHLNPQKDKIRLLTPLPLDVDFSLEQSPATGEWKKAYPSKFEITSENDVEKAVDLIILSWCFEK